MAERYTGPVNIEGIADEKPIQRTVVDNTKFEELVRSSWGKRAAGHQEPAIGFTVNADAAKLVESRLRAAAKSLNLGVAIEVYPHDHPLAKVHNLTPGQVRVKFEARPKSNRGRKPGSTNAEKTTVSAPAAPAAKRGK